MRQLHTDGSIQNKGGKKPMKNLRNIVLKSMLSLKKENRNLTQYLIENRIGKLSVNTQSDNDASLSLYQKIGFVRTGEYFPVLVYPIGTS